MISLRYSETIFQEIIEKLFEQAGVRLLIKREDQNHPFVSGNKWWKLKYNLEEARRLRHHTLLTFGGAYSNHLYATAAAAEETGLKSIAIVRGERAVPLNHVLSFTKQKGMLHHYVSREVYRKKEEVEFIKKLREQFGDFYLIPEGGTNILAVKGTLELGKKVLNEAEFDYLITAVGTGGTLAGMIAAMEEKKEVIGVSVLKNGDFLRQDVSKILLDFSGMEYKNWSLLTSYHHGGYAKTSPELLAFIAHQKRMNGLSLDWIYTGKLLWAIYEEVKRGRFKRGSTILAIHTGGLHTAG